MIVIDVVQICQKETKNPFLINVISKRKQGLVQILERFQYMAALLCVQPQHRVGIGCLTEKTEQIGFGRAGKMDEIRIDIKAVTIVILAVDLNLMAFE